MLPLALVLFGCHPSGTACESLLSVGASAHETIDPGDAVEITAEASGACGSPSFSWTLEGSPAGSQLTTGELLSEGGGSDTLRVTPDVPGEYTVAVEVSDDSLGMARATVTFVATEAECGLVADAGPDLELELGQTATLDGSGSSDSLGGAFAYRWALASAPAPSSLTDQDIEGQGTATAGLVADTTGLYIVALVLENDACVSDTDTAILWVSDPGECVVTAYAGERQEVARCGAGDGTIGLDGAVIENCGVDLNYEWALQSSPEDSSASSDGFDDHTVIDPTFAIDLPGEYVFSLAVSDGSTWYAPDLTSVHVADDGVAPVAEAGADQAVEVEAACTGDGSCEPCPAQDFLLDGSGSEDDDGDVLHYAWSDLSGALDFDAPTEAEGTVTTPALDARSGVSLTTTWTIDLAVSDCAETTSDALEIAVTCTGVAR